MYISALRLKNIRCFKEAELLLDNENGDPRLWATLVGDNGAGKTTLLRSLAIALCDEAGAYGLLSELWGDIVGANGKTAVIEVEVRHGGKRYGLKTTISESRAGNYKVQQPPRQVQRFPFAGSFVCAYGPGRGTSGSYQYDEYSLVDAVYTLFRYDQPLQNPELALRRWAGFNANKAKIVCRWLEHVLILPDGDVTLEKTGIRIRGRELATAGDGYQATTAWLLDLISWAQLKSRTGVGQISGIVLIDELEQHLHPTWQRGIVRRLRDQFPRVQFVTTTHSPLCAAGVADVEEAVGYLGLVAAPKGETTIQELSSMEGWPYDQILRSRAFGLSDTRNIETEKIRRRLHELYARRRPSAEEKKEIRRLARRLTRLAPNVDQLDRLDRATKTHRGSL